MNAAWRSVKVKYKVARDKKMQGWKIIYIDAAGNKTGESFIYFQSKAGAEAAAKGLFEPFGFDSV